MRIAVLSETLSVGGAETFAVRLANALAGAGHQVVLAVMVGERIGGDVAASLVDGVQLHALRLPAYRLRHRADRLLRVARLDWSLVRRAQARWFDKLVREFQPDIVHSHLLKADALALQVRASGAHTFWHVLTMHGDYAPFHSGQSDPQRLHIERVIASVLDGTDAIIAICQDHEDWLRRSAPLAPGKLHRILNGYVPGKAAPVPELPGGKFRFGMVSRGIRQKGWAEAVEAFRRLSRADAELILVGEGPFIAELRRESLPENVRLEGHSAFPLGYIRQFDVCLLPSTYPAESLPTVVIEYLHAGKPVIATAIGEVAEMLTNPVGERAGVLLEFDGKAISVDELAGAMRGLMDDQALRAEMGERALSAFAKFDMAICLEAHERLYAGLLGSRGNVTI